MNTLKLLVESDDYMITVDIKSGYQHVPIHKDFHKYLGIEWNGQTYIWQRLPFGLNLSAFYFVKVIRSVVEYIRSQNVRCLAYVDDFIVCSKQECIEQHRDLLLQTLANLGFQVNTEKSALSPATTVQFIGYCVCTVNEDGRVWLTIPPARISKLRRDIQRVLNKGQTTARSLARIAGQCISMVKAVVPGKLLVRNLYRLLKTQESWQNILVLDKGTINDLVWWRDAVSSWNGCPIQQRPVDIQMETDASSLGWGAYAEGQEAQGIWNFNVSQKSSNYRELLTVLLAMLSLVDMIEKKSLQILSDNVTTVCYINMKGGPSKKLTEIATAIWALAFEKGITLSAKHLSGVLNVRADTLSRLSVTYEWQLNPHVFEYLDSLWGPHTIDRFSSMVTTLLPCYNSRYRDPNTSGVDALAQTDWDQHLNFVNAPFRLIGRVIQIIQHYCAEATIIAPWWPAQAWHRQLCQMASAPPLRLPNHSNLCWPVHPRTLPEPRKNKQWKIFAWRISGKIDSCS